MKKYILIPFNESKDSVEPASTNTTAALSTTTVAPESADAPSDAPSADALSAAAPIAPIASSPLTATHTHSTTHTANVKLDANHILSSIPIKLKPKARAILLHIQHNSDKIDWNEKGEISLYNRKIEGSHIIDLIKCSLFPYKNVYPKGLESFLTALRDSNIPQTLLIQSGKGFNKPPPGIPGTPPPPSRGPRTFDLAIRSKKGVKWLWQKM